MPEVHESQGDAGEAAKALAEAGEQLGKMELDEKELEDLRDQLAPTAGRQGLDVQGACERGGGNVRATAREGQYRATARLQQTGHGGQGERPPAGRRAGQDELVRRPPAAQFNPKGKKVFDGYAPGQAFKKKPGVELAGEIQQAAQEAPDAIEVQRIPKAARDMAKGYFKNLGGHKKRQPAKEKPKNEKK